MAGRVQTAKALAYRRRWAETGPPPPSALPSNDDFIFRFTDVAAAPTVGNCATFGGFSRRFELGALNGNWYTMLNTVVNQNNNLDMANGLSFQSWNSAGGCVAAGPPDFNGIVASLIFFRGAGTHNVSANGTPNLGPPILGNHFMRNSIPSIASASAVKRTNAITTESSLNVGLNGNIFIARGPLTSAEIQNLFDTTPPT